MHRISLFLSTTTVGGLAALIGGVVGGGLSGDAGFFLGWAMTGVAAVYGTVCVLVRLHVVPQRRFRSVALGSAIGTVTGSFTLLFGGALVGLLCIGLGALIADIDASEQENRVAGRGAPVA